jgi:cellulose synthase/poly-beta-1,6-N-acetylglucosamine synthase-like glycosyltransferase
MVRERMTSISTIIFYIITFLSVYVQVFFLVTFLENRKRIVVRKGEIKLAKYPSVTVMVPCWNEEDTVYKTVRSLLSLNYPKNKLSIFLIDDGSTDRTWNILEKFTKYNNVKAFKKENGGKHTALNLGLSHVETDFVGCLDADSIADKESLIRVMSSFEKNPDIMAVAPSVVVHDPRNIVQGAQTSEYYLGVFLKQMLGFLGAIHVTPGPLTIFRTKVFHDLGPYRRAHNTEDMEIAYRMQKNHYKIAHCNDAYIYTNTPHTISRLFKQRLRWVYGFINNTIDYRNVLFRKKYGNFALFTLPAGLISILAVSYLFGKMFYNLGNFFLKKFSEYQAIGSSSLDLYSNFKFDTFFINPQSIFFVFILVYLFVIGSVIFGKRMAEGKWSVSLDLVYFFSVFGIIAPFWLMKAVFNTLVSRAPDWR